MARLGDKNMARELARQARMPVVPGSAGLVSSVEEAQQFAHEVDFPVLIKAVAGGGGRGMRVAANDLALQSALQQARAEAEAAFGNGAVYLEKYIEQPRHVEVQVLADLHGKAVHLWERDCSVQRRHQKLIEESPSQSITPETRQSMCEAACRMILESNYTNAATVEFIVDKDGNFYFIEVNARIQVEHPVTEMVTGIDLIKQQILIAGGEPLPFKQEDIQQRGVSIECRINAEDPRRNFQPSPGRIERLIVPGGFGIRFDSHAHSGYIVPPYYDSMIGKLIVHGPTRGEAIALMQRALLELRVEGIQHTSALHQEILNHSAFVEGRVDTTFVERTFT
jgi:acetyl-CoA carboxylase biotin carboxylase subunit